MWRHSHQGLPGRDFAVRLVPRQERIFALRHVSFGSGRQAGFLGAGPGSRCRTRIPGETGFVARRAFLQIHLGPSLRLGLALSGAHLLGGLSLLTIRLPAEMKLAALAGLGASLAYWLLRDGWRRLPGSVVGLALRDDGPRGLGCEIRLRNGRVDAGVVLGSTLVVPALVVLRVRAGGPLLARTIVIPGDAVEPAEFRNLRVTLRWGFPAGLP